MFQPFSSLTVSSWLWLDLEEVGDGFLEAQRTKGYSSALFCGLAFHKSFSFFLVSFLL